jgi:hypothetical protein
VVHLACLKNLKHFLVFLVDEYFRKHIPPLQRDVSKSVSDLLELQNLRGQTPFEVALQNANIELCVIIHNLKKASENFREANGKRIEISQYLDTSDLDLDEVIFNNISHANAMSYLPYRQK